MSDSYSLLTQIRELSKIRPIKNGYKSGYSKIMFQGANTEMFAYNVGAVDFKVYSDIMYGKPYARIWLETTDDGDMGAWLWCNLSSEAADKVEQVKTLLLEEYNSLPDTFAELNKIIAVTGLVVENE